MFLSVCFWSNQFLLLFLIKTTKKATANKTKLISKTSLHQVFRLKRNYHKTWINTMYHLRVNWFKVRRLKITTNNKYILIFEKNIHGVASSILNTCVGRGTLLESHWVERIRNFDVYYGFFLYICINLLPLKLFRYQTIFHLL